MTPLSIHNLSFSYSDQELLKNVNLTLCQKDLALLVGENGSGKSTLLKCILGKLSYQGTIQVFGKDVRSHKDSKDLAYVPQQGEDINLSFPVTVFEYVLLGLYASFNFLNQPSRANKNKARQLLEELGLGKLIHQPLQTLSGGQRQRVFIAQALVKEPKFLILDEPTIGIDASHLASFKDLLIHLNQDLGLTILMVTHDPSFMNLPESKVYKLDQGVVVHG